MNSLPHSIACAIALFFAASFAAGQDETAPSGPDAPPAATPEPSPLGAGPVIPSPFPVTRYETVWTKNPFKRKTVVTAPTRESALKDWALGGMSEFDGKIRVSIVNKQTGEYKRLSIPPSEKETEFELVKANFSKVRADASAEIRKGSDVETVKYDSSQASRPITINNTQRQAAAGTPGQPGQPLQPGQMAQPGAAPVGPGGIRAAPTGRPGVMPANSLPQPGVGTVGAINAAGQPIINSPMPVTAAPSGASPAGAVPPTISRRRQLVPSPVIPAQQ